MRSCSANRPIGVHLSGEGQPSALPGVQERWKFIELAHRKAPWVKSVPMLGSMGCPYTCSFCIDSVIPYQPLDFESMKADLRFLLEKFKHPIVAWHDPNYGIQFDAYMSAIEEAVPPDSVTLEIPEFYVEHIRKDLGALWEWLPEGALYHDPNAYLKIEESSLTQLEKLS